MSLREVGVLWMNSSEETLAHFAQNYTLFA